MIARIKRTKRAWDLDPTPYPYALIAACAGFLLGDGGAALLGPYTWDDVPTPFGFLGCLLAQGILAVLWHRSSPAKPTATPRSPSPSRGSRRRRGRSRR